MCQILSTLVQAPDTRAIHIVLKVSAMPWVAHPQHVVLLSQPYSYLWTISTFLRGCALHREYKRPWDILCKDDSACVVVMMITVNNCYIAMHWGSLNLVHFLCDSKLISAVSTLSPYQIARECVTQNMYQMFTQNESGYSWNGGLVKELKEWRTSKDWNTRKSFQALIFGLILTLGDTGTDFVFARSFQISVRNLQ